MRSRVALVAFVALGIGGVVWAALDPADGGLATLLAAFALVAGGFAWLEHGGGTARDLTLVATLGGIAAAGRVLFAPIPSVQPVTVIVAAAGVALGPRRGFAVGALAAIASNMFLGQGPHTPWQMLAWGGCGLLAGVFGFALRGRSPFALFCAVLGWPSARSWISGLFRLLSAHVGGTRDGARGRGCVQHRARAREFGARPRRRARVATGARPPWASRRPHRGGVGMRWLAMGLLTVALAGTAASATGPAFGSAVFLAARQSASGGFAEQGRAPDASLTAGPPSAWWREEGTRPSGRGLPSSSAPG